MYSFILNIHVVEKMCWYEIFMVFGSMQTANTSNTLYPHILVTLQHTDSSSLITDYCTISIAMSSASLLTDLLYYASIGGATEAYGSLFVCSGSTLRMKLTEQSSTKRRQRLHTTDIRVGTNVAIQNSKTKL